MKAEILSIGTELLVGSILNTNARFLGRKLAENALDVHRQTTVGDNAERIARAIEEAFRRADLVITTGGLGPTEDDVTVRAVARVVGRPLVLHRPTYRAIERRLKARGMRMTRLVARQCWIPAGAEVVPNANGTAAGLVCGTSQDTEKKWLIVLPGPPRELEPMFGAAFDAFARRARLKRDHFIVRSVRIAGLIEIQVAQKVGSLLRSKPPLTVGIYAKPGEVELAIMAKASSRAAARRLVAPVERRIRSIFGRKVYGADGDTLSVAAGRALRGAGATVAVAESCTGGLVAQALTDTAGSSLYFKGGVVAYTGRAKTRLLGMDPEFLKARDVVSARVARAMAVRAREKFGTSYGIGVTGNAGPALDKGSREPVGTVYVSLASPRGSRVRQFRFSPELTRSEIRSRAAHAALDMLRLAAAGSRRRTG